jgi:hypothetical protein
MTSRLRSLAKLLLPGALVALSLLTGAVATSGAAQASTPTAADAVAAVESGDVEQLASLLLYQGVTCGAEQSMFCGEGDRDMVVPVIETSACEGVYLRQERFGVLASRFLGEQLTLVGLYPNPGGSAFAGNEVAVFSLETPTGTLAHALFVSDLGVTGISFGCGLSPEEFIQEYGLDSDELVTGI